MDVSGSRYPTTQLVTAQLPVLLLVFSEAQPIGIPSCYDYDLFFGVSEFPQECRSEGSV